MDDLIVFGVVALLCWASYGAGRASTRWKPLGQREVRDPSSQWGD